MRIMRFHTPTARDYGRRGSAIVSAVWLALGATACSEAPSSRVELVTRAETSDFRETSSYADVVAFMEGAAATDSRLHFTSFGFSFEGRALPLAVVGDLPDADPETVRNSGKTVVYLQGNIHAGEVCGKEALQILLRDLVEGRHAEWIESMVLLVAPIYNADGNERVALTNRGRQNGPIGGMGQRPNAQGYDLNRDHMKLDSPEARSLARLFTEYDPHVALDLHTTNGTRHAYLVTYAPPLHPNTPEPIDRLLRDELLPHVTTEVREKHGWEYYYYGNAFAPPGSDGRGWYTFDHRPRFGSNYVGLRNRFALLSEAYSYASFEDRVRATLYFVEETLDYVHEHGAEIRAITRAEDSHSLVGDSLAVRVTRARSEEPVDILMGEVEEARHPLTGRPLLRRREARRTETMYEYGTFDPAEWEAVPAGHLVPAELEEVVIRLRAHGIRVEPGAAATASVQAAAAALEAEAFRIDSVTTAERVFQGHSEQTLFGRYEPHEMRVSEGDWWVPADQPLGRLAFMLLEPRSDDGFAAWGFLTDHIQAGGTYPIVRLRAFPTVGAP